MDERRDGILAAVRVESPCPKRWSELVGDERTRYCGECRLHVTNLSAMTGPEAERFLEERRGDGRVCVTYVAGAGGAPRVAEPASGERRCAEENRHRPCITAARGFLRAAASFVLGLVGMAPFLAGLAACGPADDADGGPQGTRGPEPRPADGGADPGAGQAPEDGCIVMGEIALPEPVSLPPEEQRIVGRLAPPPLER